MPGRWLATWLALALLAPAPLLAAPLVLKDDYRSPRNRERDLRRATTLIVLHTTEAHAKSSLNKLSERGEAHYCVVENGTVYRIVDRDREAFHAGRSMWNGKEDCDEFSIGIEVVGHHDQAVTLQQLDALKELIARLKRMYSIPDSRVVCHSHVAYGAPNTWHKKKHRGRKRCGMLFAMPSVRAKLGLAARPASDPDVKARRLVQVDSDLAAVLYGSRDTMAATYGRPSAAAGKAGASRSKQSSPTGRAGTSRPPPQSKPQPKQIITVKSTPAVKPAPIVKPVLIVKSAQPVVTPAPIVKPAHPKQVEPPPEEETDVLAGRAHSPGAPPDPTLLPPRKLERPPQVFSRDPRDLVALEAMPGYVKGGPVSAELTPYSIAGAAWRSPTTYYYMNGRIITGDKVNEKLIEKGAFIFYKK